MSDDTDHYLIDISKAIGGLATRVRDMDDRLVLIANHALVANAIAYLASGLATEAEAKDLQAYVRKELSL